MENKQADLNAEGGKREINFSDDIRFIVGSHTAQLAELEDKMEHFDAFRKELMYVSKDLVDFKTSIKEDLTSLKIDVKQEFVDVKENVKKEITSVKEEVKKDIGLLRTNLNRLGDGIRGQRKLLITLVIAIPTTLMVGVAIDQYLTSRVDEANEIRADIRSVKFLMEIKKQNDSTMIAIENKIKALKTK